MSLYNPLAIAALRSLATGPQITRSGLCGYLRVNFGIQVWQLTALFERWPEFSGNPEFPVPHPIMHPQVAYRQEVCDGGEGLWDLNTAYGKARRQLCLFIANEMEGANAAAHPHL